MTEIICKLDLLVNRMGDIGSVVSTGVFRKLCDELVLNRVYV